MNKKRMEELLENGILTSWQRVFVESCLSRPHQEWSVKQLAVFAQIEENNTIEQVRKAEAWKGDWRSNKVRQESFAVACEYYRSPQAGGYYRAIVERARDPQYVPTEAEYERLCKNSYTERVLASHFSRPLFAPGELVQFRAIAARTRDPLSSENGCIFRPLANTMATVIRSNALPVQHAKKGSKVYKVFPVGASRPYYVLESAIKKLRRPGKKK
jgi:hypothetical protein